MPRTFPASLPEQGRLDGRRLAGQPLRRPRSNRVRPKSPLTMRRRGKPRRKYSRAMAASGQRDHRQQTPQPVPIRAAKNRRQIAAEKAAKDRLHDIFGIDLPPDWAAQPAGAGPVKRLAKRSKTCCAPRRHPFVGGAENPIPTALDPFPWDPVSGFRIGSISRASFYPRFRGPRTPAQRFRIKHRQLTPRAAAGEFHLS